MGNRQTSKNEKKAFPARTRTCAHKQQEWFVAAFCLHVYPPPLSLHPSPNRFSYPLALSSLLLFCPLPPLPGFLLFSSFSCSSLQYTVPGGDSSKSNCLSISHQCTASRGSCPLKTMKVGLSAEPGIRFNYINKELCLKKKGKLQKKGIQRHTLLHYHEKPVNISAVRSMQTPRSCNRVEL